MAYVIRGPTLKLFWTKGRSVGSLLGWCFFWSIGGGFVGLFVDFGERSGKLIAGWDLVAM